MSDKIAGVRDQIADEIQIYPDFTGTRQHAEELADEILAIEIEGKMVETKHDHVAGEDNMDTCAECGKDIRNSVHYRHGEKRGFRTATINDLIGRE